MALILRPPGSNEALEDRLADLGRTRKRFALAAGIFTFIAAIVGSLAFAGFLDAAFHLPPLVRGCALVSVLALGGLLWLRGVSRPSSLRTDPLAVALELEEHYPSLNDALASAITFLADDDAAERGVSNRLQRVAVRIAQRLVDRHEFERLIPSRSCWRAGWLCAIVLGGLTPLILVNPGRALTALVRLADPFGSHPWPTKTRVEILVPEELPARIPKGEPFVLKFVVRGVIKDQATVVFRLHTGEEFTKPYPLAEGSDSKSSTIISDQIDPGYLPASFSFRIIANDYDTGWKNVEVVPPPRLVHLDGRPSPQFHFEPPAYIGMSPSDAPDGAVVVEIPNGTVIRLRAASDRRLSSAALIYTGDKLTEDKAMSLAAAAAGLTPAAHELNGNIPLALDGDGRTMSLVFTPAMSGPYTLRMTDETGLAGTQLLKIIRIPDPSPTVVLLHPVKGQDPTLFTPDSAIPIAISADDKVYALRQVFVEYRVGADGALQTMTLADVRDAIRGCPAVVGGLGVALRIRPTSAEFLVRVPVAAFKRDDGTPVRDGDLLFLNGAADDWDDVTIGKPPGRSIVVEIHIAAADAIEGWLQRELAAMRTEFLRLREQQREARQKTAEAIPLPDGSLALDDRNKLKQAEQLQSSILGKVNDAQDGLRARADVLGKTVRANHLPKSKTTDRVDAVTGEIKRLAEREMEPVVTHLDNAQQFGARAGQGQQVADQLKKVRQHQNAVDEGLTNLLDLLAEWGGAAEIRVEARVLRDQVNRQLADGEKLAEKVPGTKVADLLKAEQKADLERAAGKVDIMAEQAGSILTRALRLAAEKEKIAEAAKTAADRKAQEAAALRAKASASPKGSPQQPTLNAEAKSLQNTADDLKALADKSAAEAAALRKAIEAAGGQALPNDLANAAGALRSNQQILSAALQRSAVARLEKLGEALAEKTPETAPDLEKLKPLADDLNALSDAQDELRKRTVDAGKISDPVQRAAELKKLAAEQEKLIERGKDLLQRLTRERADAAARDARAALDQMESARDDLEKGKKDLGAQNEAVERLDTARDRIDAATQNAGQQLADEKRRKMADKVKALVERQRAAVAEMERILGVVKTNKKWERPLLASYADLEDREKTLALEVRALAEKEFAPLPVLSRLLSDAGAAMETSADKAKTRREDALDAIDAVPPVEFEPALEASNDRKVKRPMALALRRLEQLLEVLKDDPPKPKKPMAEPPSAPQPPNPMGGARDDDVVPALAQLKVLRSLQAELNQRTAEFAKEHPDKAKLTDEERDELKELEDAQRDIAKLFQEIAKLFPEGKLTPETPDKPDDKQPEKSEK